MSLRNPFKRQNSNSASLHLDPISQSPAAEGDHEKSSVYNDHSALKLNGEHYRVTDPANLSVDDLDEKDKLSSGKERGIESAEDIATRCLSTEDDPSMPANTFRMYFLGLGFTCFSAILGQIFYFRPAGYTVSSLFIVVVSYIFGELWAKLLPRSGKFWGLVNPGDFNIKEHVCILIMSSTGFASAMAISVFAADELYYDLDLNYGAAIFTLLASQFYGYGLAGLCRSFCVFPTFIVFPSLIPTVQLFDVLHRDQDVSAQKKRFRFFGIAFVAIFVWEWFPEFIAPTLTGVSVFCLARRNSTWVSRIFGGSYPNEGFAMFSLCFDWSYIQGMGSLYTPITTSLNIFTGCGICILVTTFCWTNNVFSAQNFPWMAQDLFYENGTLYDQTLILDADYNLNITALQEQGLPWYTTSMFIYYIGCNLAVGATIMHGLLWYAPSIRKAISDFRDRHSSVGRQDLDAHYRRMLVYPEVPMYVYGGIILASFVTAIATCYTGHSHLPWYGVVVAFLIAGVLFPLFVVWAAITGWQVDTSNLILMLGAAVVPGNSQANMYFTLFGAQASAQGISLAQDLKLAQYTKIPPRTTVFIQSLGTVVAGILQIVMCKQIVSAQREVLLDPSGNNIWSGQQVQSFNSQAITWGALAKHMFAPGTTYDILPYAILIGLAAPIPFWLLHRFHPKMRTDLVLTPLLCYTLGELNSGINSQMFMAFILSVASMWFSKNYRPTWFRRYNYILSAALDAGTVTFVFIATFAIFGGTGNSVVFPSWALNPANAYPDYCAEV